MEQIVTHLTEGGRIVIPAALRRELNLSVGDEVILIPKGREVVLMSRAEAIRRAQAIVRRRVAKGRSLVDELLAERREE